MKCQNRDEDMTLAPIFGLVKNRPKPKMAFKCFKTCFDAGEACVDIPDLFFIHLIEVGAQDITANHIACLLVLHFIALPGKIEGIGCERHFIIFRNPWVAFLQPTHLKMDFCRYFQPAFENACFELLQIRQKANLGFAQNPLLLLRAVSLGQQQTSRSSASSSTFMKTSGLDSRFSSFTKLSKLANSSL